MNAANRSVRRRSLRSRLTAVVAAVFAITLVAAGLAARSQFRSTLEDNVRQNSLLLLEDFIAPSASGLPVIDETEVTQVVYLDADGTELAPAEIDRLITDALEASIPGGALVAAPEGTPVDPALDPESIVVANGPIVAGETLAPDLSEDELAELEAAGVLVDAFAIELFTPAGPAESLDLGDDSVAVGRRVNVGDETLTVAVAAPVRSIDDAVAAATLVGAGAIPILTLLVAALTWLVTGRTLRPVEAIRRQVARTDPNRLDRHVPRPGSGDEIDRLAGTMNDMLDRLHTAGLQHRRFISDASHELRSPITATLATVESTDGADIAERWPDVAATIAAEQRRLERLVDDLLLLAELDERGERVLDDAVDLDELVLDEVARPRAVPVHAHVDAPHRVEGNERLLSRALANLVDNAARHATSRVDVTVTSTPAGAPVVRVDDDGPGIPASERARVTDRFARLDEARGRGDGGAGLGLAIVHEVAVHHGAELRIAESPSGGARFEFVCPAT